MAEGPLFTIGIPTFNRAAYLRQAITSALRQSCGDFELIVSDNASSDETPAVAAEFSDARLRFVRQPVNQGAIRNINFLVQEARGRYFVLHQDDDLLHPEFLARARAALAERNDVVLFTAATICGPQPQGLLGETLQLRDPPWVSVEYMPEQVLEIAGVDAAIMQLFALPFVLPGVALKTEHLRHTGAHTAELAWAGDNLMLARVALCGAVLYDPRPGAFTRMHAENESRRISTMQRFAARREANRIIVEELERVAPQWRERARELLARLPRKRLWKFLATAWEGDYPPVLKRLLADVLAGSSPMSRFGAHATAALFKGKISRVTRSRLARART